jgi:regulator of PEP synthase PpsR (kinase-PPPase family)
LGPLSRRRKRTFARKPSGNRPLLIRGRSSHNIVVKQSIASADMGCVHYLIADHGIKKDIDQMISQLSSPTSDLVDSLDGICLESHAVVFDLLEYSVSRQG